MMICPRNLSKHLKNCYQTKTIRKMFQHDFHFLFFCKSYDFFSQKKVIKYFLFIFFFHICANFQTQKINDYDIAFEFFQSHCHILKELLEFLCMMSAITNFGKNSSIFSFVDYELVTKSLGVRCTFEEVAEKTKCQKMNVNFLQPN
jgi:hypothetical protein